MKRVLHPLSGPDCHKGRKTVSANETEFSPEEEEDGKHDGDVVVVVFFLSAGM